jgi:hypothetical protein
LSGSPRFIYLYVFIKGRYYSKDEGTEMVRELQNSTVDVDKVLEDTQLSIFSGNVKPSKPTTKPTSENRKITEIKDDQTGRMRRKVTFGDEEDDGADNDEENDEDDNGLVDIKEEEDDEADYDGGSKLADSEADPNSRAEKLHFDDDDDDDADADYFEPEVENPCMYCSIVPSQSIC